MERFTIFKTLAASIALGTTLGVAIIYHKRKGEKTS